MRANGTTKKFTIRWRHATSIRRANEILRPDAELIKRHCVRQCTHGTNQKISPL